MAQKPYDKVAKTAAEDIGNLLTIKKSLRQDGQRTFMISLADRDYYGDQIRSVFDDFSTLFEYNDEKVNTKVEYMSYGHSQIWHVSMSLSQRFGDDIHTDIIRGDLDLLLAVIRSIVLDVLLPARKKCLKLR